MDVFSVRDQLVADYREFTTSFVAILDPRVRTHVEERNRAGYQWPDPWLSLNPNFARGSSISELVASGDLDPECGRVFRIEPEPGDTDGPVLRLHHHQKQAVKVARQGHSYVLTTGTGSGRSLTYSPVWSSLICDYIVRQKLSGTISPTGLGTDPPCRWLPEGRVMLRAGWARRCSTSTA